MPWRICGQLIRHPPPLPSTASPAPRAAAPDGSCACTNACLDCAWPLLDGEFPLGRACFCLGGHPDEGVDPPVEVGGEPEDPAKCGCGDDADTSAQAQQRLADRREELAQKQRAAFSGTLVTGSGNVLAGFSALAEQTETELGNVSDLTDADKTAVLSGIRRAEIASICALRGYIQTLPGGA